MFNCVIGDITKLGLNTYEVVGIVNDLTIQHEWKVFVDSERSRTFRDKLSILASQKRDCPNCERSQKSALNKLVDDILDNGYEELEGEEIRLDVDTNHLIDGTNRAAVLDYLGLAIPGLFVRLISNGVTT